MIRPVGVDLLELGVIKMDLLQLVVSSIFFIRLCYVVLLDCITSSTVSVKFKVQLLHKTDVRPYYK